MLTDLSFHCAGLPHTQRKKGQKKKKKKKKELKKKKKDVDGRMMLKSTVNNLR